MRRMIHFILRLPRWQHRKHDEKQQVDKRNKKQPYQKQRGPDRTQPFHCEQYAEINKRQRGDRQCHQQISTPSSASSSPSMPGMRYL